MSSLDPRIEQEMRQTHDRLVNEGEMLSKDIRQASFNAFRSKFGPDRLRSLDGRELLQTMHTHGNKDSLVYWLEYKDDEEFAGLHFGGISGGSAHAYGIFRRRGTDQWVKGSPRSEENISEEDAIAIARKHRDQLVAGSELLLALPHLAGDAEYVALQKAMEERAPDLARRAWVHKYFFVLFPDKLDDFHNEDWQRYYLMKLLQEPPQQEGLYVTGGRYARLAAELGWPVDEFSTTLKGVHGKPKQCWRVGTRVDGESAWEDMKAGNYVAVGWSMLGDLSEFANNGDKKEKKSSLIGMLESNYPADPRRVSRDAGELLNFVSAISEGDLVVAGEGETVLAIGRIAGAYIYDNSPPVRAPHRRPVEWFSFDHWKLLEKDGPRTTVWLLRKAPNLFEIEKKSQGLQVTMPSSKEAGVSLAKLPGGFKHRLDEISGRVQGILERKGQVILYGPPGTGKTYWARRTALDLAAIESFGQLFQNLSAKEKVVVAGDETGLGLVRCCTFHPAYGYEDFLEGYRPQLGASGQLAFQLRDGIFKRICDDARKSPERKFILLIDEINRGDIPRIFGELLTLLELDKRGMSVILPSSGTSFHVPKNVYVLGTMNTADRSIALLDTALRRRFGFVELMPDYKVLDGAVVGGATPLPIGLWLSALNERIRNHLGRDARNLQVGHAYFLSSDGKPVTELSKLVRILADDIVPLLEEYCYEDYSALTQILGDKLVDPQRQRIREELFKPERLDELVKVLLGEAPDIATAPEATLPGETSEEVEDEESEDGVS
ncbi:hypothetical protein GMLC_10670 [Geomonas limicola]|uniref:AAA+ ATPase domain-containing protein n=1 Tax=Geomonas limicola TaxID=2740186 RepID=A0A6V8N4I8_9BACT|nr:AAA family ATPase [Geomonas limicola]GFO67488.1 hypothetical protein GMLC_10670 [Geomonas limicola]